MNQDLTSGPVTQTMLRFAVPMILGNLLQQLYNVVDTLIVGRYLGTNALAAVGSAYTLMIFLTSILLGLCMGSGVLFSKYFGEQDKDRLKNCIFVSFILISLVTVVINVLAFVFLDDLLRLIHVPQQAYQLMRDYVVVIFLGLFFTFLYNFFSALLLSIGNSVIPLCALAASALINVGLDLLFVLVIPWGVAGAAMATVIAQALSALGMMAYTYYRVPQLRLHRSHMTISVRQVREITQYSSLTCVQQSVMNLGILMVQGLINSFGVTVMAAFAAAVKIDSFAYMPLQDFGNAFSTFVAQNQGAGNHERIRQGIRSAAKITIYFCLAVCVLIWLFTRPLMQIFVQPHELEILSIGIGYLRLVSLFYPGIACLFLLYGYYRAIGQPGMSVILTILSLGTRVFLAHLLASLFGVSGIWWAIPIGWLLADCAGIGYGLFRQKKKPLE